MTHTEKVKIGWSYHGVVKLHQVWCAICAKQRWHETVESKTVCLACCDVTDEVITEETVEKPLEVIRFYD